LRNLRGFTHLMQQQHMPPRRIPQVMIERYIASLNRLPLKIFPIQPEDMPEGIDPFRGSSCHCQLGNVYQVLAEWGVDVDQELPWIRPWFLKYQMTDGGMNCDNEAYLVTHECPSSMVGTIAAFEAVLLCTPRQWTPEEKEFLNKGASFLMGRGLMRGSSTVHNASEQKSAADWVKLCFPRFYLYDILRGLNALSLWAEKTGGSIPQDTISEVVLLLEKKTAEGQLKNERHSFAGTGSLTPLASGGSLRKQPASFFPLLEKVSQIGEVSSFLSKQWAEARRRLKT
jgi:hypothetical protein